MANLSNINNHFIVDTSGKGVFGDVASFSSSGQHGPLNVFKSGAAAAICIDSSGGSGRMYQLRSETNGAFVIYDNPSCDHRMEISSGGEVTFSGNVKVTGAFKDSSGDTGTSGQILSSTATGSNWIDNDTGDVSGSGTTNAVAKFTGAKVIGDGPITFATNDSTFAGNVSLGDDKKILLGAGDDFRLDHDGSNSFINNLTGAFILRQSQDDGNIAFQCDDGSGGVTEYFRLDGGTEQNVFSKVVNFIGGAAGSPSFIFEGDDDTGLFHPASNTIAFSTFGNERMRIDSSGNMQFNGNATISSNTADGSDNAQLIIAGGGTDGDSRGASVHISGNESGNGGLLQLRAGSGSISQIRSYTSASERMRIDSSGNVGIGTTSPNAKLDILGASSDQLRLRTAESEEYKIGRNSSTGLLEFYGTQSGYTGYVFGGVNGTRLTIDSSGNATFAGGIKVNGPASYNTIKSANEYTLGFNDSNDVNQWWIKTYTNGAFALHENGVGDKFTILAGGNVGIGTTSPSQKLEVVNAGFAYIRTRSTSGSFTGFDIGQHSGGGIYLNNRDNTAMVFMTNNTERMNILAGGEANMYSNLTVAGYVSTTALASPDGTQILYPKNSGNVGIGTTSPSEKLQIVGNTYISGVGNQLLFDTTGDAGSNKIKTINDYETVIATDRGSAGFAVIGNSNIRLGFGTNYTNAETDLYIDTSGNVGIGTTSPASVLEVYGGSSGTNDIDRYVRFKASNGEKRFDFYMGGTGNASSLGMYTSDGTTKNVQIASGGTSYFNGGEVGINTTTPNGTGTKLQVNSASHSQMAAHFGQGQNNSSGVFGGISLGYTEANANYRKVALVAKALADNAARQDFCILVDTANDGGSAGIADTKFKIDGLTGDTTITGTVTATADVVAYSDKKLKKNIKTLNGSKVYDMRGVSFTRKDNGNKSSGVIAQEIQKIAPELVNETDGTLGVAYGNLTGYLIEAIKELKAEIEELKSNKCNCNK
jgi:hypothetical protein